MRRCIVHIGMHKTGSTSIQRSFHGFESKQVVYALLRGGPNHSLPIFSAFGPHPDRHHLHRADGRTGEALRLYIDQVWMDLERSIATAQDRTLLISGEDIGYLPRPAVVKLHDYLKSHFDGLTVMAYVRPPIGYIASHFQQRVKDGSVDWRDLARLYRDYRESFEKFDEAFGRENVQLWKFDPGIFPDCCVVLDFCSRLSISLPKDRIVRLNEALSRQAVALLYTYGKFGGKHGWRPMRGREGARLGMRVNGDKFRFSPDLLRPVLEKNRADIEWMEARLGQSLHEELGERQPGDVCEERDLLRPDPAVVGKLLELLGDAAPKGVKGETPAEVALLVHALLWGERQPEAPLPRPARGAGKASMSAGPGSRPILIAELLEEMERVDPKLLDGISRQEAQALVRNVFKHMSKTLAAVEGGGMSYEGLGRFLVRRIEKKDDGGTKPNRARIGFHPDQRGNI